MSCDDVARAIVVLLPHPSVLSRRVLKPCVLCVEFLAICFGVERVHLRAVTRELLGCLATRSTRRTLHMILCRAFIPRTPLITAICGQVAG